MKWGQRGGSKPAWVEEVCSACCLAPSPFDDSSISAIGFRLGYSRHWVALSLAIAMTKLTAVALENVTGAARAVFRPAISFATVRMARSDGAEVALGRVDALR